MNVPNEILASILNELGPSDNDSETPAALASWRLVSHRFCSLATPVLFSSLHLTESEAIDPIATIEQRAEELAHILAKNNFIATSVHALKLSCQIDDLENSTFGNIIAAILHRLPYIQKFVWKATNRDMMEIITTVKLSSIAKNLISAVQALLRSPNLTTVDVYNISDFPFTFITASPNLKNLCLSCVDFSYLDGTSQANLYYLDSLEIDGLGLNSVGSVIESRTTFAEPFSRLKSLTIHNEDVKTTCGRDIALLASQTLTELLYTHDELSWNILKAAPYDLSRFPLLRHLKILLRIASDEIIIMHHFLKHLLYISSSCSYIETLDVEIKWYCIKYGEPGPIKYSVSPEAGSSTLDEIVSSPGFVSLRRLIFNFHTFACRMGATDEDYIRNLELEKNSALHCVDALFPKFRALLNAQRTFEIQVKFG